MANSTHHTLTIDENFRRFIPPLSADERQQLEDDIIHNGCREPLCVWNNTILDGHHRYEICTWHHIPFETTPIRMRHREEAVAWMCARHLNRPAITDEYHYYLIGKQYEMEILLGAHYHNIALRDTRQRLCEEYNICPTSLSNYKNYAYFIDSIFAIAPETASRILSGHDKISQRSIIRFSRLPQIDIQRIHTHLTMMPREDINLSVLCEMLPKRNTPAKTTASSYSAASVKDVPEYDPDAEAHSLALTIPSWVSLLERTRSSVKFTGISDTARHTLEEKLATLKNAVDAMTLTIKEICP